MSVNKLLMIMMLILSVFTLLAIEVKAQQDLNVTTLSFFMPQTVEVAAGGSKTVKLFLNYQQDTSILYMQQQSVCDKRDVIISFTGVKTFYTSKKQHEISHIVQEKFFECEEKTGCTLTVDLTSNCNSKTTVFLLPVDTNSFAIYLRYATSIFAGIISVFVILIVAVVILAVSVVVLAVGLRRIQNNNSATKSIGPFSVDTSSSTPMMANEIQLQPNVYTTPSVRVERNNEYTQPLDIYHKQ
ncbi:hypothetical protein ABK040_012206 [Willaertia magna]